MQTIQSKLLAIHALTADTFQYDFDFGGPHFEFKAGQFFMLKVEDGQTPPVNRSYSIASPPAMTDYFSLCVKLLPGGRGSEYLRGLKVGDSAQFMAPLGHFYWKSEGKAVVMVATGTGLAPFMSMLPTALEAGYTAPIHLYFGVRHEDDLFYIDELRAWEADYPNFKAFITLSQPHEGWTGLQGRVTDHVEALALDPENTDVYICGNGAMVKEVKQLMDAKGLPKTSIHLEQFNPA